MISAFKKMSFLCEFAQLYSFYMPDFVVESEFVL